MPIGLANHDSIVKMAGGIVEAYYEAYHRQDYDAAVSLFYDELFQKVTREKMKEVFAGYRAKLGDLKCFKVTYSSEDHSNGESRYVLQCTTMYEKLTSHDTFSIHRKTDLEPLKLTKVEFNGPGLTRLT